MAVAFSGMQGVEPTVAGILTAAYGVGTLVGSAGVMLRPLCGDAARLMIWLVCSVAAALAATALSTSFPAAAATNAAAPP